MDSEVKAAVFSVISCVLDDLEAQKEEDELLFTSENDEELKLGAVAW